MRFEERDSKLTRTIASTETLKLAELHMLDIFYTPIEERFERITRLARRVFSVPVAAVTLISHDRQWFKSVAGWAISELPLDQSLCTWTVQSDDPLIVPDTLADSRFAEHPLVQKRPKFRFYAGYPLIDKHGVTVGTFCIMDLKPRKLSATDTESLRDLAYMAQGELLTEQMTGAQSLLANKLGTARREAMIDSLTGLWNRRGGSVLLKAAFENADRRKTDLALGVIDIDRFKQVNDLHGHQIGDEALRKVARVLTACMRGDDVICRPGGDEFLMIMTDTKDNAATQIVERVRRSVAEMNFRSRQGSIPITVSAGYAIRQPGDPCTEDELFKRADDALMASKNAGRNRVRMAS